jgi:hypothetical protein
MFIQILQHTPLWVWAILAALIALGVSQTRTRHVGLKRATIVPLVFIGFSLSGVIGTFGLGLTLVEWLAGVVIAVMLLRKRVAVRGAEWSESTQQFTVPGSFTPLMLIVGVFLLRYTVGVGLAMHPEWAHETAFASACALAYGGFAGLFWARAQSLRQFARVGTLPMEQSL